MINSVEEMSALVDSQIIIVTDPLVRSSLQSFLIPPVKQQRGGGYDGSSDETFLCWLVLEDMKSDTGIVYSDFGFGPSSPWGLVFLSNLIIGDDSGWFQTLEHAFYDSFAAGDLKIWSLIKKEKGEILEVIEVGLTLYEAFEKRDKQKLNPSIFTVEHRLIPSK